MPHQPFPASPDDGQPPDLATAIRQDIMDGTLKPGQKLREVELGERYGVSRTPIREALMAIQREGLLLYEVNRGFTVRTFSQQDLEHAYEMRALLEGYACRFVAERGIGIDTERRLLDCVDGVDALLVGCAEVLPPSKHEVWKRANVTFHQTLMHAVANPFLSRQIATVQQIPLVQHGLAVPRSAALLTTYNRQHREILRAVVYRQGTRAEFLMREHVGYALEEISKRSGPQTLL